MQHVCTVLLFAIIIVVSMAESSSISRRHGDNDDYADNSYRVNMKRRMQQSNKHNVSVRFFAKNILCRRDEWRRYFFFALLEEFDCMKERLVEDLVNSLCTNKGERLDNLVSELFDANEDGYINEYEKFQFGFY